MKSVIIFFALVAFVAADAIIPIVDHSEVRDEAGQYSLSYKSGDGTQVSEQGALKLNEKGDDVVLVKQGTYSYTGTDGKVYSLSYTADEQGFHPQGAHIPVV